MQNSILLIIAEEMKKYNINVFEEIQQSLNGLQGNIHILEATIPIEQQKAFFNYAEIVRSSRREGVVEEYIKILNSEAVPLENKRYAMVFLSISADIKAFRALEKYNQSPQKELSNWASLALLQARMILENELSDEEQIFVSTGLGGKGDRFRFFAFLKSKDLIPFSNYQRNLIEKEMDFSVHKHYGEMEKMEIKSNYFTLLLLSTFKVIRTTISSAVEECNKYGGFIDHDFVITNMEIFNEEDIQKELNKE
ncbi:hypothetical protein [Candidatus Azobacteroides pseudotrichonymphae]|nr:hypothetical protein [Candidatus Azobacteroides pseudotrichonymphae]MDR0530279.1 hypothetical protein [Bacteroidales bacterium OttesenSCG-928-I14]